MLVLVIQNFNLKMEKKTLLEKIYKSSHQSMKKDRWILFQDYRYILEI